MKRNIQAFLVLLFCLPVFAAHAQKRFRQPVFTAIDSIADVAYGQATNLKGEQQQLLLNMYHEASPGADIYSRRWISE